jgi:hypothetical protein
MPDNYRPKRKRHNKQMTTTERLDLLSSLGLPTNPNAAIRRQDLAEALRPLHKWRQLEIVEQLRAAKLIPAEVAWDLAGVVV